MTALLTTVFLGTVVGSIYALSAFGLVLTYRASGIFNFAQGAVGMIFAYAFYQLVQGGRMDLVVMVYDQEWTLPTGAALVAVVGLLAPAFGWALDAVLFRRLRAAGEVVQIVATIGLLVALQGLAGVVWGPGTTLTPTSIFSQHVFVAGGFRATVEQVASVSLVLALTVGLLVFLRRSALGVRMRAVVDRPDLAELTGVDSARVSAMSWAIGTGFAALAGILLVPYFGSLDPLTLTFLIVAATAAAVVGRLESFPVTLAAGVGIGVAQLLVQRYTDSEIARQLRPSIPFVVLFAVLFLPRWRRRPTDRTSPPPLPVVERVMSSGERLVRLGLLAAVLAVAPFVLDLEWQVHLARLPGTALIFLSLVVVSGYGGQVSLCQAALAGFGAFTTAHMIVTFSLPFGLAVVAGGVAAVPLGAFLALRAATLSPLFLGFATLAFGAVMDEVLFTSRWFAGGLAGIFFRRPDWLAGMRVYYLATLLVFGIFAILISNLRRGRTGLALAAMRDSEVGLASVGVDVAKLKVTSFCLSAFIAGLGGAFLVAADELASPISFFKFQSLLLLALAVIGGIGTWSGALVGAALFQLSPAFAARPGLMDNPVTDLLFGGNLEALLPVFFGLGAIALAREPRGLVELVRQALGRAVRAPERPSQPEAEPLGPDAAGDGLVTFLSASLYHRAGCVLATGKEPVPLDRPDDGLAPCPVCEPGARAVEA